MRLSSSILAAVALAASLLSACATDGRTAVADSYSAPEPSPEQ